MARGEGNGCVEVLAARADVRCCAMQAELGREDDLGIIWAFHPEANCFSNPVLDWGRGGIVWWKVSS